MIEIKADLSNNIFYLGADFLDNTMADDFFNECETELRATIILAIIATQDEIIRGMGSERQYPEGLFDRIKKRLVETAQSITEDDVELLRKGMR